MAYRETAKVRQRKASTQAAISDAALSIVSQQGFKGLQMSAVASQANVATGTLYRYFPNKETLASHIFQRATQTEIDRVEQTLNTTSGPANIKLDAALRVFAQRALSNPGLAWALIAEPVDPGVDEQRLHYRLRYAELFITVIEQGISEGSIPDQSARVSSTAMVGAIAEALVGPLSPFNDQQQITSAQLINDIVRFCLRALGILQGVSDD